MRRIAICVASAAALMAGSALAQSSTSGVTTSPGSQTGMQQLKDPTVSPTVNGPNNFDCSIQTNAPECSPGDPAGRSFGSSSDPGNQGSSGTTNSSGTNGSGTGQQSQ